MTIDDPRAAVSPPTSPIVELTYEHVPGPTAAERRAIFLPGILGRGSNLRTLARRFVQARPGWDAWLIDLRGHGSSPKGTAAPSIAAAAADVKELCARSLPVAAIIGHSFGGKVALEVVRQGLGPISATDSRTPVPLQHVLTIDSNPGVRAPEAEGDSAPAVLQMLQEMPAQFASRAEFVDAVVARGKSRAIGQWLAMSTEATAAGGIRFALDLNEIKALMVSYFASDLWPVVAAPPDSVQVHLVVGERSTSYSAEDRTRLHTLLSPRVTADFLPTGHWVHSEDLEGLLRVMWARIP